MGRLSKKSEGCERFVQIAQMASILGIKEGDSSPLNNRKMVAHAINFDNHSKSELLYAIFQAVALR